MLWLEAAVYPSHTFPKITVFMTQCRTVALGHIFFFVSLKLYKQNLWLAATMGPRATTYSFLLSKTIMVAAKKKQIVA